MRLAIRPVLGLVVIGLLLTGCTAPAQEPEASREPAPTPTSTPTIEPVVVGAAEMPPIAFDGDCSSMLTEQDLAEVVGQNWSFEGTGDGRVAANVGALNCHWGGADYRSGVRVTVIPRAGLDGAQLSPDRTGTYYSDCSTAGCSWQGGDDQVWVGIDFIDGDLSREEVDAWGAELGGRILERHAEAGPQPWVRDKAGWWPVLDCAEVADAVGSRLGQTLVGSEGGWEDLPAPWYILAHEASRATHCVLQVGDTSVHLSASSGTGSDPLEGITWQSADLGVPGIEALVGDQESIADYALTDGINGVSLQIYSESGSVDPRDIAVAVAAAAALGFE